MAKCIYVCSRNIFPSSIKDSLNRICSNLVPDNIVPTQTKIVINGHIGYAIMNPTSSLLETDNSLLMGQIFNKNENWSIPLEEFPNGSYALFRSSEKYCEIVSDSVASRTIWYYFDETVLIASTSQRAIIMFLRSFEFDERVIPWMLSTGSLGPTFSWDKRLKRITADSSLILDKTNWSISSKSNPIEFDLPKKTDREHKEVLTQTLKIAFESLNLNYAHWALPLSGGYDSRGILCLLSKTSNIQNLRTVTWGLESSIHVKESDAYVAKKLAEALQVSHKYYHTDLSKEPIEKIINRFVLLGEGRIDHLPAYMDGFKIWKTLFEDGIEGTIRGDENFGWESVSSALNVRTSVACGLCSDFSNLKDYEKYGLPSQKLPEHLDQKKEETFSTWRDRLYQEYRTPTVLAALADLKLAYVEQINPFLAKSILKQVRQLPDHLRTDKALFKKIVASMSPKVHFASREATASTRDILSQKQVADFLRNELSLVQSKRIFSAEFLEFILRGIKSSSEGEAIKANSFSLRSYAKKHLPGFLKTMIRGVAPPRVNPNVLAFRVFLICKMNEVLSKDCLAIEDLSYSAAF